VRRENEKTLSLSLGAKLFPSVLFLLFAQSLSVRPAELVVRRSARRNVKRVRR